MYFTLWWVHLNESMRIMVKETWESEKGTIGWKNVVTYQKQRLAVRATVFPFLIFWVHVNQGSERILWKEVENWAHWKNVLTFTDPNFSSTRRAIWIILEKEMEEKGMKMMRRGKDKERRRRGERQLQGVVLVLFWSQCNQGELLDEARDWLLSRRMSWETKEKRHRGDRSVLKVRVGSMRFPLLEGEALYSLTKQRSADAGYQTT